MLLGFLEAWAIAASLMLVLWIVQQATRDAGVVDVGWAAGLAILGAFHSLVSDAPLGRRVLVGGMVVVWGLRLALHLLFDRVIGKPEDGRYQAIRANRGPNPWIFFLVFFEAQGLLGAILAVPFQVALASRETFPAITDYLGLGVWLTAVLGESLADRQLARFRARPGSRGKTCRDGLWRTSRHPNYFFEWLHWWSYPIVAFGAPLWALTLTAPAIMLFFLLRVTGIPATEAQALKSRGDDYRDYQRTTSAFVPWFPKSGGPPKEGAA